MDLPTIANRPDEADLCRHGHYVGDEPAICAELVADDAWNDANPPLLGHLIDQGSEDVRVQALVAELYPELAAPFVTSRLREAVIVGPKIPDTHGRCGGKITVTAPGSRLLRCARCHQGFRQSTVSM